MRPRPIASSSPPKSQRSVLLPSRGLIGALVGWTGLGVLVAFLPVAVPAWAVAGGVLAALGLVDGGWVSGLVLPEVERRMPGAIPLGVTTRVTLRVASPRRRFKRLKLFDHAPDSAELVGLPATVEVPRGGFVEIEYELRPRRRGDAAFGRVQLSIRSPWGLWRRLAFAGKPAMVRVLPNFRPLLGFAHLMVEDRLAQMGIRHRERRGEGREFRELREFRQGDAIRQIDWKATSRRNKLIAREYQDETDQRVVVMVDCGRRMRALEGDIAHFDHAINGVLLLAYAATRAGDAVGLTTFSGDPRWVPPTKGAAAITRILEGVYDLETSTEPPDYLAAAVRLASLERRRALVVVVSNLRDEDASELLPALRLLSERHLVLLASLRERALEEAVSGPLDDLSQALFVTACRHYLAAREKAHDQARGLGVHTLDVEPDRLAVAMVNRYLDIKRAGLL